MSPETVAVSGPATKTSGLFPNGSTRVRSAPLPRSSCTTAPPPAGIHTESPERTAWKTGSQPLREAVPGAVPLVPDLRAPGVGTAGERSPRPGRTAGDVRASALHRRVDVVSDDQWDLVVDQQRAGLFRRLLGQIRIEHRRGDAGERHAAGA